MQSDVSHILLWYGAIFLIGWGSFPLVCKIFRYAPDHGAAFSKMFGLFLSSYLIWLTVSLGTGRYQQRYIVIALAGYVVVNGIVFAADVQRILTILKTNIRLFLGIEGLFVLMYLAGVIIRMYNPDITGAEKEADLTILNAILHSDAFPPKDTWFAGETINYYYFGYLIWATIIKATDSISPVGYNLAVATIPALAAVGIFGLVYHLTRKKSYSLFASCVLVIFGNLDGLIQILQRRGEVFPFDWWRSSRIIPDTINEFPFFSFLLGDLHAHFMAIPFLLVFLALLLLGLEALNHPVSKTYMTGIGALTALFLGGTAVINTWDYPGAVILTLLCLSLLMAHPCRADTSRLRRILGLLAAGTGLLMFSRLFFWPFYQHFTPQLSVTSLRLVDSSQRTEFPDMMIIYGLFLWGVLPWLYATGRAFLPSRKTLSREASLVWGNGLLLAAAFFALWSTARVLLLMAGLSGVFFFALYRRRYARPETSFPLLLLAMAFAILAGCEILYMKDFYGHPLERQNTIFKFPYQAWILLAAGMPALVARTAQRSFHIPRFVKNGWKVGFIALCCASCIYPVGAALQKTNFFRSHERGGLEYVPTLNGIQYIAYRYPDEYDAMLWIQRHLAEDAVILEATGNPYSFFGRVAATTGRSTVLGWGNHEALWRDQTWQSITQRTKDIKAIYDAEKKAAIMGMLHHYRIEYVYIGTLERETYTSEGLRAFHDEFSPVYENKTVTMYKTPF